MVSSRDMTIAFGSHSVVSGEMGILSLRDYKSSKKICNSVYHSSGLRGRVQEQLMRRQGQELMFLPVKTAVILLLETAGAG